MKTLHVIFGMLLFYAALAKQEHKPFIGDVLTIACFGINDCHPPNSFRGDYLKENLRKVIDKIEDIAKQEPNKIGSGFVHKYGNEIYVITCEHVIHRADTIKAYDAEFNEYDLVFVGDDTFYDVAVLKFADPKKAKHFKPVKWQTKKPDKGEILWNVGYWNANGSINKLTGEVAETDFYFKDDNQVASKIKLIEIITNLSQGFSGGPTYNKKGELVAMNTKRYNGYHRSFAIQSNILKRTVQEIIHHGGMLRAFYGLWFTQAQDSPVKIMEVFDDAPATSNKDILTGSSVLSMNSLPVSNIFDVLHIIESLKPKDTLSLQIKTQDEQHHFFTFIADRLHKNNLEKIACHVIRAENKLNNCVDIYEQNDQVIIKFENDKELKIETIGYRVNQQDYLIYCLNNLAHLGSVIRLVSLYGIITVDKNAEHLSPYKIWLSKNKNEQVLYY